MRRAKTFTVSFNNMQGHREIKKKKVFLHTQSVVENFAIRLLLTAKVNRFKRIGKSFRRQSPHGTGYVGVKEESTMLWADPITLVLKKTKHGYGFTVIGSDPVRVGSVQLGAIAEKGGLKKDDCIVQVNGQNVAEMNADQVARIIKASPKQLVMQIQRRRQSAQSRGSYRQPITAVLNRRKSLQGMLGTEEPCREAGVDVGRRRPNQCITSAPPQVTLSYNDLSPVELSKQNAINKLLKFEDGFLHSLQFCAQKHRQLLRQCMDDQLLLSQYNHSIFKHADKIGSVMSQLMEQLHDNSIPYIDTDDPNLLFVDGIGANYKSQITNLLDAYESYFVDLSEAKRLVEDLSCSAAVTENQDKSLRQIKKALRSFIQKPGQHLQGLGSHLQTILCYTSPHHHDYPPLLHVVQVLQESISNLNNMSLRRTQSFGSLRSSTTHSSTCSSCSASSIDPQVHQLDNILVFAQNVKVFKVAIPHRHLLHQGQLVHVDGRRWVPLQVILFSDLLLLTTKEQNQLVVVEFPIFFTNIIQVNFHAKHPLEFQVTYKVLNRLTDGSISQENRTITLRAPDSLEMLSWQHLMQHNLVHVCIPKPGVHLEEPLTPHRSWDGDLDESSPHFLLCPEEDSGFHVPMSQADKSYPSNISEEFSDKCSLGALDAGQLRSKSESPHKFTDSSPTSCLSASSRMPCLSASDARTRISSPESSHHSNDSPSPDPRDVSKVHFSFGSDSENEDKTPKNLPPVGKKPSGKDREHRRGRFRRMLRPLRRSHSAGCAKDVPAHALFLKHEMERKQKQLPRRSFDRQVSFESDTEDQQPVEKKGSKKKRSFTKDMKEKFFFLRRRHTDTALSGQAEGKSGKLHIDTIIEWSKDFENLLMDKYGLELFRDFLRSEYSEENVEFWIACQDYKSIKQKDMATRAHEIYSDFVAIQAPHEINLDSKTRLATMSNLSKPNAQTFEMAQKKIQGLMAKDSYRRFLQSDIYQSLLGDHKINL